MKSRRVLNIGQPPLNFPNPRESSLDWICRALADALPREDVASLATRAENIAAIAESFSIATEDVVRWIHVSAEGKEWTAAEFRRFCELFSAVRKATELPRKPSGSEEEVL